jgi:hypothetical protein
LSRSDPAGRKKLEATVHTELCERLVTWLDEQVDDRPNRTVEWVRPADG